MSDSSVRTSDLDVRVESVPAAASRARRLVAHHLARCGREDLGENATLAASELVTNATLHGRPPVRLRVVCGDEGVRLEVTDASRLAPQVLPPRPEDVTGRGMAVVAALSARWGWELRAEGKVVWCEVRPDPPGDPQQDRVGSPSAGPRSPAPPVRATPPGPREPGPREPGPREPGPREPGPREPGPHPPERLWRVCVPDVPVAVLRDCLSHTDAQLRELHLIASRNPSTTAADLGRRARDLPLRHAFLRQLREHALEAERTGQERTDLRVEAPLSAAETHGEFVATLENLDSYCRTEGLPALESPPILRCFRRWLVQELCGGVRRAAGMDAPPPRRFEAALMEEVHRVSTTGSLVERVLEAAPDAMIAVDRAGIIRLANAQTEQLFGYRRQELVGQPVELLVPETLRPAHGEHRRRYSHHTVTRPMGAGMDLNGRRRDGSTFPVDVSLSGLDTAEGLLVTAAIRDVTDTRAMRRSLEETHKIAEILQRSLLDALPSHLRGLDIAARYLPAVSSAMVGGDWHDVFALPGGLVGLTVGDVSGHGIEAAAVMGRLRTALAAIAAVEPSPATVLTQINHMLCRMPLPLHQDGTEGAAKGSLFATTLYGQVDPRAHEFTYALAGHPGPVVVDAATGEVRLHDVSPDPPLGVTASALFTEHHLRLPERGRLLMFTDGLYERRGTGLTDSLRTLTERVAELSECPVDVLADALVAGAPPTAPQWSDDLALIVLGW